MVTSDSFDIGLLSTQTTATVFAPLVLANCKPAKVYGVVPLAEIQHTMTFPIRFVLLDVIFRNFVGLSECSGATGHQRLYHFFRRTERWRAFGCVEYGHAAAFSRTHVKNSPLGLNRFNRHIHGFSNVRNCR